MHLGLSLSRDTVACKALSTEQERWQKMTVFAAVQRLSVSRIRPIPLLCLGELQGYTTNPVLCVPAQVLHTAVGGAEACRVPFT